MHTFFCYIPYTPKYLQNPSHLRDPSRHAHKKPFVKLCSTSYAFKYSPQGHWEMIPVRLLPDMCLLTTSAASGELPEP